MESFGQHESATKTLAHSAKKPSEETQYEIVQCPKCQTKFAVDPELIENHGSAPRFHCSRCDNLFTAVEFSQSRLPFKNIQSKPKPTARIVDIEATDSSAPSTVSHSRSSRSLEIPRAVSPMPRKRAPHEHNLGDEETFQEAFSFDSREDARSIQRGPAFSVADKSSKDAPMATTPFSEYNADFDVAPECIPVISRRPRSPLAIMGAPMLLFLAVLAVLSVYIRTNEAAARQLAETVLPSMAQIAPPNLFIKNAELRPMVLSNGESVYVVSGSISNQTNRSFKEIIVEVQLMDQVGNTPIITRRVNAGSTLAKTRIKSLTYQMIDELQSGRMARHFELAPSQQHDFAIALHGSTLAEADFYTLRIYSVR